MLKLLSRNRRLLALLALAVALVAFSSAMALASPAPKLVKIGDFFFKPKKLTITKGTSVKWQWVGAIGHNVTVKTGPVKFHSKTQIAGTFSHLFTKKGTYTLYCTIHPTLMRMTIVVK